ncbi:PH domain-containing protein [Alkalicoccobacillus porphyridii]|uniref:Uncharacterized protein YyaB-like PH domain-containing protein n=1 Tax=Alkalicoccobacillus porphyridii TaxID=2597270 RepID=A0A553ZUR4_9BACI|nr:PH domain-containing protein [Alkalicoccobacillus porphyridii]TSB45224.1 hypothetical protein FN960_17315 [Alkalicoccobacillus porphyridii]
MYKSKLDWKFITVLTTSLLICLVILFSIYFSGNTSTRSLYFYGPGLILGLIIGIPIFHNVAVNTFYELKEDGLYIRSGFSKYKVEYELMESVHPVNQNLKSTFNLLSNINGLRTMTAFSGTAIRLNAKWSFVKISPKEEEKFLNALLEKVPNLERSNDPL